MRAGQTDLMDIQPIIHQTNRQIREPNKHTTMLFYLIKLSLKRLYCRVLGICKNGVSSFVWYCIQFTRVSAKTVTSLSDLVSECTSGHESTFFAAHYLVRQLKTKL